MSEQDRRECWSCGSTNVWVEDWNGPIYIKCHGCKVRIGPYADEPTAIAAWNQRAGCASCRDEAIAAALAVEQKCYDQAQEIKALRALREALDSALEVVDGEWVRDLQVNPPKWRAVMDALIASKQASAPTGDEHTK